MPVSPLLATHLHMLACPVCHAPFALDPSPEPAYLDCTGCSRRYPIVDGLPVLIAERSIQKQELG